ncbi:uncharacterized protein LOC117171479 [Belonocnema kinseyi]|uniref:uncharacterized protein LOC117171479 n=1 Tax=Belonocnema kinseyi TaxID=2817044 RepID=UPI00143D976C|nr:uncharacterized protein LOC117171479 [Belonocnema kinseyi]
MIKRRKQCLVSSIVGFMDKKKQSKIGRLSCFVCDYYILGSPVYVIMLGLIGTVITAFDIIRIMNYNLPVRCKSRSRNLENSVPIDVERDLKLMTCILAIEHYTLIMLGAITEYPMLHTPWLLMQLCIMIVEVVVFFVRLFLDGLYIKRDEIFLAIWSLHNWLQVFCSFHRHTRYPT